jgi:hypothetical protein
MRASLSGFVNSLETLCPANGGFCDARHKTMEQAAGLAGLFHGDSNHIQDRLRGSSLPDIGRLR